jgi:hypothetical protein
VIVFRGNFVRKICKTDSRDVLYLVFLIKRMSEKFISFKI